MSRRIEVTVPNEWAEPVRKIIDDVDKCNLSDASEKPHMVVELKGLNKTIFFITLPGPAIAPALEVLKKNGIGTSVGRIILTSLEYTKPDLSRPLALPDVTVENIKAQSKAQPLKGFAQFQKARKTNEEMYAELSNNANITINTWMNLVGASVMAAGGLVSGVAVFIVASMLVSPIMGPILGMVMGYRVADWPLFKNSFINEVRMAAVVFLVGLIIGLILGDVGATYKWPNDAMMVEGQAFNLIISIIVSAAAGMVLGVSLTSTGGNALVGTAISAGLLPPLVNAGMMLSYASVYAPKEDKSLYYGTSIYNVCFYSTHVVTIVIVANFIFWLKDIDPRFREIEDVNFNDVPSLVEHKKKLQEQGKELTEKEKAEFFFEHIKEDIKNDVKQLASGIKNIFTGSRSRRGSLGSDSSHSTEPSINPMFNRPATSEKKKARKKRSIGGSTFSSIPEEDELEDEEQGYDDEQLAEYESGARTQSRKEYGEIEMTSTSRSDARDKVIAFYKKYNPSKLSTVDTILEKYEGKENELLQKLYKQYNISS